MNRIAAIVSLFLLVGCSTTGSVEKSTQGVWERITGATTVQTAQEAKPQDPFDHATARMMGLGVVLVMLGIIVGVFTKFTTGWGLNLALSGFLMITLAWAFQQWWVPWLSLVTIIGYIAYRLYMHEPPPHKEEGRANA